MRRLGICVALLWLGGTLGGCALLSGQGGSAIGKPDWVERGAALVVDGTDRRFVAVGQARDKLRLPLLKQVAQRKAMTAVGEPLKAYLRALAGPWLQSLDPKFLKEPESPPVVMLDKLLERCVKLGAIDEVFVEGDGHAVYAMARVDLMAVTMEMQASADVEPMLAFLAAQGVDLDAVFDKVAAIPLEPPPAEEPAAKAEAAPTAAAASQGTAEELPAEDKAGTTKAKPKGKR